MAVEPGADLARIEQAIEKVCGISGAEAFRPRSSNRPMQADAISADQPPICPRCQRPMGKHGRRRRTLQSTLGDVAFTRQLYRCGQCAEATNTLAPADAALGIKAGQRLAPFAEESTYTSTPTTNTPAPPNNIFQLHPGHPGSWFELTDWRAKAKMGARKVGAKS